MKIYGVEQHRYVLWLDVDLYNELADEAHTGPQSIREIIIEALQSRARQTRGDEG